MTFDPVAAAVFVKTPGYSALKTRLAAAIGTAHAEEFHRRATVCVRELLKVARETLREDSVLLKPVWAVAEPAAVRDPLWSEFDTLNQGSGGLGDRLDFVYRTIQSDHERAILLGADSPQISPQRIVQAARFLNNPAPRFCIGPAVDGGFYLFGGNRPLEREIWTSITYSTAATGAALSERIAPLGELQFLPKCRDVDTVADLAKIATQLVAEDALGSQRELAVWINDVLSEIKKEPPRESRDGSESAF